MDEFKDWLATEIEEYGKRTAHRLTYQELSDMNKARFPDWPRTPSTMQRHIEKDPHINEVLKQFKPVPTSLRKR